MYNMYNLSHRLASTVGLVNHLCMATDLTHVKPTSRLLRTIVVRPSTTTTTVVGPSDFATTVIDSILQDLTPADRWLQLCLHEHVFGISNATAYCVPSVLLPGPSTPFVNSGPCADVSPCDQLVNRPSRAPHSSLTDLRLADDADLCLLDTANPRPVDDSVIKGFSSHTMQIDELQDTLPEHVRELFQLTVEVRNFNSNPSHNPNQSARELASVRQICPRKYVRNVSLGARVRVRLR